MDGITALFDTMILAIFAAIVIVILQSVMTAFNFTGDFAAILTLIFGSVIGVLIGLLVLKKLADGFRHGRK